MTFIRSHDTMVQSGLRVKLAGDNLRRFRWSASSSASLKMNKHFKIVWVKIKYWTKNKMGPSGTGLKSHTLDLLRQEK